MNADLRSARPPLFGTSGVRGVVGQDLTEETCHRLGRALGTFLHAGAKVCLATDTRVSADMLKLAIISGLLPSSVDVTDLGILPTPALALLTRELSFDTGIMLTASHNPPEFNGVKLFGRDSLGYSKDQELAIERIYHDMIFENGGHGILLRQPNARQRYMKFVQDRFASGGLNKVLRTIVDPGNGAASGFVTELFTSLGLQVIPINDEPDGRFPGRNPEPKEDTLQATIQALRQQQADLAICFDGDADRVVFCDRQGFLGFNEMISYISRLAVRNSGKKTVATTVEAGSLLDLAVKDLGAEVVRGRVGDVPVAYLAQALDAAIGVEQVGVYILPEAGYYPDSILASLTLMSSIKSTQEIRDYFSRMPRLFFEKRRVDCPNSVKEGIMQSVRDRAETLGASRVNLLDGARFEFDDAWMLIRASGTEPTIRVIAESTSKARTAALLKTGMDAVQAVLERTTPRK